MQARKTLNELRGKPTHDGKAEGKGGEVSLGQMLKLKISWLFLCYIPTLKNDSVVLPHMI